MYPVSPSTAKTKPNVPSRIESTPRPVSVMSAAIIIIATQNTCITSEDARFVRGQQLQSLSPARSQLAQQSSNLSSALLHHRSVQLCHHSRNLGQHEQKRETSEECDTDPPERIRVSSKSRRRWSCLLPLSVRSLSIIGTGSLARSLRRKTRENARQPSRGATPHPNILKPSFPPDEKGEQAPVGTHIWLGSSWTCVINCSSCFWRAVRMLEKRGGWLLVVGLVDLPPVRSENAAFRAH